MAEMSAWQSYWLYDVPQLARMTAISAALQHWAGVISLDLNAAFAQREIVSGLLRAQRRRWPCPAAPTGDSRIGRRLGAPS